MFEAYLPYLTLLSLRYFKHWSFGRPNLFFPNFITLSLELKQAVYQKKFMLQLKAWIEAEKEIKPEKRASSLVMSYVKIISR